MCALEKFKLNPLFLLLLLLLTLRAPLVGSWRKATSARRLPSFGIGQRLPVPAEFPTPVNATISDPSPILPNWFVGRGSVGGEGNKARSREA